MSFERILVYLAAIISVFVQCRRPVSGVQYKTSRQNVESNVVNNGRSTDSKALLYLNLPEHSHIYETDRRPDKGLIAESGVVHLETSQQIANPTNRFLQGSTINSENIQYHERIPYSDINIPKSKEEPYDESKLDKQNDINQVLHLNIIAGEKANLNIKNQVEAEVTPTGVAMIQKEIEYVANDSNEESANDQIYFNYDTPQVSSVYEANAEVNTNEWEISPIDYHRCGRCKCYFPINTTGFVVDCQSCRLLQVPMNLSRDTTFLNLRGNRVPLVFINFTRYQRMRNLDMGQNKIFRICNATCGKPLLLHFLDLSDNEITTINDNFLACLPNLRTLILRNNKIQVLTAFMLQGARNLQHLDLGRNGLDTLNPLAFHNTIHLKVLKLNNNKNLTYGSKTLSLSLFKPLKSLESLHIQMFTEAGLNYYPLDALIHLTSLKELYIDGSAHGIFGKKLLGLNNLSIINVGVDGHCVIQNITKSYFIGVPNLRSVHISGCYPKFISTLAFQDNYLLENLKYSSMGYNIDSLFESLSGLQNFSIKTLSINAIDKFSNQIACRSLGELHGKAIKNMSQLTELNLENNKISLIQHGFLANLPNSLKKLNIRRNTIDYTRSITNFSANKSVAMLQNLIELKEDLQNHADFSDDNKHVGVLSTNVNSSFTSVTCNCKAQKFSLPQSSMYTLLAVSSEDTTDASLIGRVRPPLQFYSASKSFNFGTNLISKRKYKNLIRFINMSNTFVTTWGEKMLSHLVEVADFSGNFCENLKISFFAINNSLTELHVSGNVLGESFGKDRKGEILSRLSKLRYLDLSRNHIRELPHPVFVGLTSINVINLASNNLRSLNVSFSNLRNLIFVNLSMNSLSWISKQTRDDLDYLSINGPVSVDLTSNRLLCTCDGLEVLQWMVSTIVRILNKDFLECVDEKNDVTLIGDLQQRFQSLQRQCVSKTFIILTTVFSILVVLLIVSAVLVFRNRWRLHYFRNIAIAKMFGYTGKKRHNDPVYSFDVYIIYSHEDGGFVLNECLKELEEKRNYKVCVEHRDFVLGSIMPCTITSAICSSRMTIPVISPELWASEWGEYAVQMAIMESTHTHRYLLHFIIYKQIATEKMPQNILKMLTQNNFCEYPPDGCDDNVKEAFWDALSHIIGNNERAQSMINVE